MDEELQPEVEDVTSFSDELTALHEIEAEARIAKTAEGIVIQHRHERIGDDLRSDDDKSFGESRAFDESRLRV